MAFGRPTCIWRRAACDVLDDMNREYRVLFTSFSATVIAAAVLSGLAISVLPECALRPGMRVLGEADGFGALPDCKIGIMRGHTTRPDLVDALARHISESLDNISVPAVEEAGSFDFAAMAFARMKRGKPRPDRPAREWCETLEHSSCGKFHKRCTAATLSPPGGGVEVRRCTVGNPTLFSVKPRHGSPASSE